MKKRLIPLVAAAFCLAAALVPGAAFAEQVGAFEVTGGQNGIDYSYDDHVLTIKTKTELTIKNIDENTPTSDRIVVEKDKDADLIFAGVNITAPENVPAFSIEGDSQGGSNGHVSIFLKDHTTNVLRATKNAAGLEKNGENATGTLYIDGEDSSAILEAYGEGSAAGIGGGAIPAPDFGTSNIHICGGKIIAVGGDYGAGIGSGWQHKASNISVVAGTVIATGNHGAGIGGGSSSETSTKSWPVTASYIVIGSGGVVTASSNDGAGIGGGRRGMASNVIIHGGSVKATSQAAVGIGSGGGRGVPTPLTPKNLSGEDVYLAKIPNSEGKHVKIDGHDYPANNASAVNGDTVLYAYLTAGDHKVTVGSDTVTCRVGSEGSKILVTADATAADRPYDGTKEARINKVTLSGYLPADHLGFSVSGEFEDPEPGQNKTVHATVTLTGENAEIYELTNPNLILHASILKADPQFIVQGVSGLTYSSRGFRVRTWTNSSGAITYASRNPDVATVDERGNVTITGVGTGRIEVTIEETDYYASQTVPILVKVDKATHELDIAGSLIEKTVGDADFAALPDAGAVPGPLTYSSSNERVATVGKDGIVHIVGAGTTTITVSMEATRTHHAVKEELTLTVAPSSTEPDDPTVPTVPTAPTVPTEPTEPTGPTGPTGPTEPAAPTEPNELTEPNEPAAPAKPAGGTARPVALASAGFTGKAISLKWGRVKGATAYEVYAAKVGSKGRLASKKYLVKTLKATSLATTLKKVGGRAPSAKGAYRVKVRAYRLVGGKKRYLASAPALRVVGKANKALTDVKKVTVSPERAALKAGAAKVLKARLSKAAKGKRLLSSKVVWRTSDATVATVSAKGRVTAKKEGSCTVYAIAANGKRASVKVTVG